MGNSKDVVEVRDCVDCHAEFSIREGERRFFESKNLTLPKRCTECRAKKRAARQREGEFTVAMREVKRTRENTSV